MKKRWKMIGVVCAIAILSAGCKSKESEAPTPSSTQEVPAETAETEYQPEPVETLIQTGQLLWPVPVLAGGGIALVAAGLWLSWKRRHDA